MRRPFLDSVEDNYENGSNPYGVRNHERNQEIEEREGSYRGSQRRQSNSQSRLKFSQMSQSRLDSINQDLRFIGFKELAPLCYCEANNVDSICEVIKNLISEFNKCQKKNKDNYQNYIEQRNFVTKLEKDVDQLKDVKTQLTRDKEYLNEKIKGIIREQKEKDDKNAKDKDAFAKERKSWNQKEESFKMCVKTYEDKLNNLEKKINKMQKGDKIEYKNTFEVNVIFQKTERILLGKEYAQMVAKQTVEAQKTFLQDENNELKDFIKEIFEKTQRIAHRIERQMGGTTYREEIVDIPINFSKSRGFPDIMRNYLNAIEEKVSEVRIITNKMTPTSFSNCNEDDLNRQINELKGYYSTWQQINDKRKMIIPSVLQLLKDEQKIKAVDNISPPQDEKYELTENNIEIQKYIEQKKSYYTRELNNISDFISSLENLRIDLKEQ